MTAPVNPANDPGSPARPRARVLFALVLLFLLAGAARFIFAIAKEPGRWMSRTYMESVHEASSTAAGAPSLKRRWGPLFPPLMTLAQSASRVIPTPLLIRILLAGFYAWTVYMLVTWGKERRGFTCRDALIVALALQSTAAIYGLANGNGELITAACIVGNSYFFVRRRYAVAALLICLGVYFKLHPIVFAFPYFVFAALSAAHRRYCAYVAAFGLLIGLACVPLAGWANGFFYPFSMLRSVSADADIIPIVSREVFAPIFLVTRAITSFQVRPPDAELIGLTMTLIKVASVGLVAATAAAAVILRRKERRWDATPASRRFALLVFDATIGFCFFFFAVDFSILHLLLISLSLFAPLWLLVGEDCRIAPAGGRNLMSAALYALGTVTIGTIVPLSVLLRLLPLAALDRVAGNPPAAMIPQEKYIWYQIPMFGLLCIAAALALAALAARARRPVVTEAASAR